MTNTIQNLEEKRMANNFGAASTTDEVLSGVNLRG
jgi:hypothetical protein